MKTIITWTAAITLALAALAFAGVPQTINYQGYLKDSAGAPVSAATTVVFSLYSSNPARSNPVWRESKSITPANGVYSTQLGSITPITAPFDALYYLGVKVGADAEMALQPLSSSPYAQRAAVADAVAPGATIHGVAAWTSTAATTLSAVANSGYILTGATLATLTLPTNAAIGDVVRVTGQSAGGYTVNAGNGQAIVGGNSYTFVPRDSRRSWTLITSSAEGTRLAAIVYGGQIYTSSDSGVIWTPRDSNRFWQSITSSADGAKLAAVVFGGQIYTSDDIGATWTPRDSSRNWYSITSSADGAKLAAVDYSGQIYTSGDSGGVWTPRDSNRNWNSITSSADGTRLAAVVSGGQIYTSGDSGVTWTPRDSNRGWQSITSSADGVKLAAVVYGGQIYTSGDSGVTWVPRDSNRNWNSITSSADGTKLAAVVSGGQIYTSGDSGVTWTPRDSNRGWQSITSSADGVKLAATVYGGPIYSGSVAVGGAQNSSTELLYSGNGQWSVSQHPGNYVAKTGDSMGGTLSLPINGLSVGASQLVVSGGKVGIGTAAPEFTLDVNGTGRVTSNFDIATAVAQIGFNRNSINGYIYDIASKAWQMGSSGAAQNDDFVISSWNTNQSPIATVLRMTPAGNATFAGTIESTSGGIKFPDGTVQVTAKLGAVTGVVAWNSTAATTLSAAVNSGYILIGATPATVTLPTNAVIGDVVRVTAQGEGGYSVTAGSGQVIVGGNSYTFVPRDSNRYWYSITSSADGVKLAAVVYGGQIYTSGDSGVTWTPRDSARNWFSITSSADGVKLAAAVYGGQIYTSGDSGVTWAANDSARNWYSITSAADGVKLAAVENGGQIYTSSDSGITWAAHDSLRSWQSITSSADGGKLAAVDAGSQIYTSGDGGVTWIARDSTRNWRSITSSADGVKLAAVVSGGQIYTSGDSGLTWTPHATTRGWQAITSSADGVKLAAAVYGGQIYTSGDSGVTWDPLDISRNWRSISSSSDGSMLAAIEDGVQIYIGRVAVGGTQNSSAELVYSGNGQWSVSQYHGNSVAKTGDTMSGTLNLPANGLTVGTNQLVVNGGKTGIGTATPEFTLDVNGTGRVTSNFDLTAAIAQIGFNRNSTNGQIYNPVSKAWQMGPIGAGNNDDFVISSWNTDQSSIAAVLRMTPAGNATFAGTIETTSGGIKFPDGALQTSAKTDCMGRYEDNGDGTVSDCRTGLIWLKNANCLETSGGIVKSDGFLIWADAGIWAGGLGNTICGLTDGSSAGDWRMPTKTEWMAMVANAKKQRFTYPVLTNRAGTAKWSPADPFDNVQAQVYWSSSTYAGDTIRASFLNMQNGYVNSISKSGNYYVWPIRSGQ